MRTPMIWRDCKIVVIKIDLTLPSTLYIVYNLQTGKNQEEVAS